MSQDTKLPKQVEPPTKQVRYEEVSSDELRKIQEKRHVIIRC